MVYRCLVEVHTVSARMKGKHEYTCLCYFLLSHWNTLSFNQATGNQHPQYLSTLSRSLTRFCRANFLQTAVWRTDEFWVILVHPLSNIELDLLSVSVGREGPKFLSGKLSPLQVQVTTDKRLKRVPIGQISAPRHPCRSKNMTGKNNGRCKNNSLVQLFHRNCVNCRYVALPRANLLTHKSSQRR